MTIEAVFFDLDGTLIEFQIDYKRARKETKKILVKFGLPSSLLSLDMIIVDMMEVARTYFLEELHYPSSFFERVKNDVSKRVSEIEKIAAKKAKLYPGMNKILSYLSDQNLPIGIITFNTLENTLLSLKAAGISHYFPDENAIASRDKVKNPKPSPDHVKPLIDYFQVNPKDVLIIGDHPKDILTAKNIGAKAIALIREPHTPSEFDTEYFLYHPKESQALLLPLLQKFIKE